jgi:hypothetical protein
MDIESQNKDTSSREELISRKAALVKTAKFAAFTAASMMMILEPAKADPQPSNNGGSSLQKPIKRPR